MSYSSEVLADSPIGYWRMGDASGTTMADSSGNGRHGSYISSPTLGVAGLLAGGTDKAVSFASASSQYAIAPDDGSLDNLAAFTIEALIKPATVSGSPMIAARDDTTSAGRSFQFNLSSGKLAFTKIANGVATAMSSATLSAGSTYHVVATYDGSVIRLYINGSADGTAATSGTLGASSTDLRIAARRNTTPITVDFFNGVIDEVAVYGTALSSTRVDAHYTAAITAGATGSLAETFPAFGVDFDAELQPDLDVDFPSLRVSVSASADTAAELDVTFAPFEVETFGDRPDVAAGDLSETFPSFRPLFAAETEDAISTVTTYDLDGRVRSGIGMVTTDVDIADLPAGLVRAQRVTKAIAYPTPTLVDGRPT